MKFKHFLFVITVLAAFPLMAQFHDYSVKYGIQGHFLIHDSDLSNDLSYQGRGFLRAELFESVEAEIGIGIGRLNALNFVNEEWKTNLIPSDIRLVLAPIDSEILNPYVYVGFGILRWNIEHSLPSSSSGNFEESGWTPFVPVGGAVELKITDEILLDLGIGYNFVDSKDLVAYNSQELNDNYLNFGVGLTFVSGSGKTDKDMDGLTKKQEKEIGTNFKLADTDGDKINDGDEFNKYKTDPLAKDSDKDGLDDFAEIMDYKTDPNSTDTDGDELSDFDEVEKYKTSPISKDSDKDGLGDGYEINKYKTDPSKADTDNDGLNDYEEINKTKTDPSKADSDADGLNDGIEVTEFSSNPLLKDSDNGGTDDLTEFKRKTNPKDPADDIKEEMILDISAPMVLEGVTFETGSAVLTKSSIQVLYKAYNTMVAYPELAIEIHGFTDNVGNASFNKKLSQKRADAVKTWLVEKGVAGDRIIAKGFGEENPIADNTSAEGRQKNRRIEFVKVEK